MRHRTHQRAGRDRRLQILLRGLLASRPALTGEVDIEARRDRAFGLVEDRLEIRRQDEMREQLLALDVIRIALLEEDDRVRVEDEAGLAPIGRRLAAEDVGSELVAG